MYLDVIFEKLMSLYFKVIDLILDCMWCLLDKLGNLQFVLLFVIYIVGINGKGLIQVMICVGFEVLGYSVYVYMLLYLVWFYECIWLVGELIIENVLSVVFDECYEINNGENIIFFEVIICVGMLVMLWVKVDYILLEVGLGGCLDVMNVIFVFEFMIIMFVLIDYEQFLGNMIVKIVVEKVGIIKCGVFCIVGFQYDDVMDVIEEIVV